MIPTRLRRAVPSVPRETALVVGLISGSQFVNHVFLVLLPPILTILATEFDTTVGVIGLVMGAQALTNTAFQLPYGYLADAYDRTLALGLSSVLGAAGALLTAVAPDLPTLVAGQVILGLGVAGHHPAHYPLLSDATPEDARGRTFSVYNVGGNLGFATPPVIITAVIAVPGLTWRHAVGLLGVGGLVYGLFVTVAMVRWVDEEITAPNRAASDRTRAPLVERVRSGLRGLIAEPGIVALAVLTLLATTASWGLTSYLVVFLTDVYGVSLRLANLTLSALFVLGAGAVLVGGSLTDRVGGGRVLVASYLGVSLLVGLITAEVVPALLAVGLFLVVGVVRSMAGPARDELTERLAAGGTTGTAFAIVTIGLMLGSTIAPAAFGYITDTAGVRTAFVGITLVALAAALVSVVVVRRYASTSGR